jgi:hypothetical protein
MAAVHAGGAEVDPAAEEKRLREIFDEIDEDHNGTLERAGKPLSKQDLDVAMVELDPGGSGHVSFDIFRSWYLEKHVEAGEHTIVVSLLEDRATFSPLLDLPAPYLAMMAEFIGLAILFPTLGQFVMAVHGGDPQWVGIIMSCQYAAGVIGGLILGALSDRIGVKSTIVLIMGADILLFTATAFAWSIRSLLIIRTVAGFFNPMSVRPPSLFSRKHLIIGCSLVNLQLTSALDPSFFFFGRSQWRG